MMHEFSRIIGYPTSNMLDCWITDIGPTG